MAATCAGVNCFGAVAASSQKPRALMMSAGVCGFASEDAWASTAAACFAFGDWTLCTSAEASWNVEATAGFARGIGTGSVGLAGRGAGLKAPAGGGFLALGAGGPPPSSSFDFPPNHAADQLRVPFVQRSWPLTPVFIFARG